MSEPESDEKDLNRRPSPEPLGLPVRAFLFTVDQIATMIAVDEKRVKDSYLFYQGRSVGNRPRGKMMARNIAPEGEKPEWRIAEREVIRWLRTMGFKIYDRGWTVN
jgi:hypothetical protein